MQLITALELETRNYNDLSTLFRDVTRQLARTDAGTTERAKALGSLDNISHAIAARFR
ncbi:MAG: hypothetical protein LC776_10725 [Acidobacteria bacterium]|nr:hypothetical protein [Acidobacteriota bacterium]